MYGVVPEDRVSSIYAELGGNTCPWGVRDTYPYREKFSHEGGDYHNGGVWVFLNFADALSRFVSGHPTDAVEILRRVGQCDLERWGDYMPAEYLDGNTGANAGKPIQAWDADFFGAVFFGMLGVKMLAKDSVEIMPRIPDTECFETSIAAASGALHIKQAAGDDKLEIEISSQAERDITVRYGAMTSKSTEGSRRERIGKRAFSVVELSISPGQTRKLLFG
jgi:glycogen debranching enzyme